jgi:hypothetical protein
VAATCATIGWCAALLANGTDALAAGALTGVGGFVIVGLAIVACILFEPCREAFVSAWDTIQAYGSTAVAGAWTLGVSAMQDLTVENPSLPRIDIPSTEPESGKREAPGLPPTDTETQDSRDCRALSASLRISQAVKTHILQDHGLNSVKPKDRFAFDWTEIESLIHSTVASPTSHVSVEGNECVFEYDAGTIVGVDRTGAIPRTIVRVVLVLNQVGAETPGSVITAYPIPYYGAPRNP